MLQNSRVHNFTVYYNNSEEFRILKREIFSRELYYFKSEKPDPIIADVGAYIGLSTLYFKMLYPKSKIIAIEPNPKAIKILKKNITLNKLRNVLIIEKLLAKSPAKRPFFVDSTEKEWFSTSSIIKNAWNKTQNTKQIEVESITINDVLKLVTTKFNSKSIDYLKLDVEGTEQQILKNFGTDIVEKIHEIKAEYHKFGDHSQNQQSPYLVKHLKKIGYKKVNYQESDDSLGIISASSSI